MQKERMVALLVERVIIFQCCQHIHLKMGDVYCILGKVEL